MAKGQRDGNPQAAAPHETDVGPGNADAVTIFLQTIAIICICV
jgi:hypothetical protein